MSKKSVLLSESLVSAAASSLLDSKKGSVIYSRLKAIISASHHGIKHTAEVLGISRSSLHNWDRSV